MGSVFAKCFISNDCLQWTAAVLSLSYSELGGNSILSQKITLIKEKKKKI